MNDRPTRVGSRDASASKKCIVILFLENYEKYVNGDDDDCGPVDGDGDVREMEYQWVVTKGRKLEFSAGGQMMSFCSA